MEVECAQRALREPHSLQRLNVPGAGRKNDQQSDPVGSILISEKIGGANGVIIHGKLQLGFPASGQTPAQVGSGTLGTNKRFDIVP